MFKNLRLDLVRSFRFYWLKSLGIRTFKYGLCVMEVQMRLKPVFASGTVVKTLKVAVCR